MLLILALAGVAFAAHTEEQEWAPRSSGRFASRAACQPLAIPNAIYDPPIAAANSIAVGGRVKISCAPGFENSGADWVVCNVRNGEGIWETASWSASAAPACHQSCSPPVVANAILNPSIAATGLTRHGSKVEVTCMEGFEFVGDALIECYHGEFTGLADARCFMANESFCRDDSLTPLVLGSLSRYPDSPLQATEYLNKALLIWKLEGIQPDGLSFLGLTPSTQYKAFETNVFYVPGITGSDATYQALVLPNAWNVTTLPAHMNMQSLYCRVYDYDNELTAYIIKVLYKNNWGQFSLGQKK